MAAKAEDNLFSRLTDTLHLRTELTATASHGDFAPYWMSNNRYGVASVGNNWGTLRLGISRLQESDADRKWQMGWALEPASWCSRPTSTYNIRRCASPSAPRSAPRNCATRR